jgi:hypothetical protein
MSAIEVVLGRQILDSRGNPTVEADVHLESGAFGRAGLAFGRLDGHATRPSNCATAGPNGAARACAGPLGTSTLR